MRVAYLSHEVHAVGNHDENHAHVLGEGEQEVSEVLALYDGVFLVQFLYAYEPVDDGGHGLALRLCYLFQVGGAVDDARVEECGDGTVALEPLFLYGDDGRSETMQHGIEAEDVSLHVSIFVRLLYEAFHELLVAFT